MGKMSKEKGQSTRKRAKKQIVTSKKQASSKSKVLTLYQKIQKAVELNAEGKTGKEIAEILKVHPSRVCRYLQHATALCAEEITKLHDNEVAFQIQVTAEVIETVRQNLIYIDSQDNTRVDSAAVGQLLSALNRRAKIFGLDKQAEEQSSKNGDGDTYNIVMARFEEAVERGALKKEDIPVLDA
jgi:ribosomal protein S20